MGFTAELQPSRPVEVNVPSCHSCGRANGKGCFRIFDMQLVRDTGPRCQQEQGRTAQRSREWHVSLLPSQ